LASTSDLIGGGLSVAYTIFKSSLATSTFTLGAPELGQTLASKLPASLDIGNPNSPAYAAGATTIAVVGSLATPDGDEADAVGLADDVIASGDAGKGAGQSVFRTPQLGQRASELGGLNPANHLGGDRSAYVGTENVVRDYASPKVGGYENGAQVTAVWSALGRSFSSGEASYPRSCVL
jgi:hypothetical protein